MKHLLITTLTLVALASAAQAQTKYADLNHDRDNDKTCWEWGDYVIAADGAVYYNDDLAHISLKNKVTGKYVIPVISKSLAKRISKGNAYEGIIEIAYAKEGKDQRPRGRSFFFDSSKRITPAEMDGLLYLKGSRTYKYKHLSGTGSEYFCGLYKIEEDQLQQLAELPSDGLVFYDNIPAFGAIGEHRCTTKVVTHGVVRENIHYYKLTNVYAYDGSLLRKDVVYIGPSATGDFLWVLDEEDVGGMEKHFASGRKDYLAYSFKALDFNLNPDPRFAQYSFLGPRKLPKGAATKHVIIVDMGDLYGVIDMDGNVIIPAMYPDPEIIDEVLKEYMNISYSMWFEEKAAKIRANKDEFEKQEHFEARQADPALQEAFVQEKLADARDTYLQEMLRKGANIKLGKYDAERECFPVYFSPVAWNGFTVPIPLDQAPAFKETFESMKKEALDGATYTVRNDAIGISRITFTLPDGQTVNCEM